jgi:hypothetical protein
MNRIFISLMISTCIIYLIIKLIENYNIQNNYKDVIYPSRLLIIDKELNK